MNDLLGNGRPVVKVEHNTSKIAAVAVIAVAIGAFATYASATGMWNAPPAQPVAKHAPIDNAEPLRPMDQLLRADAQTPAAPADAAAPKKETPPRQN